MIHENRGAVYRQSTLQDSGTRTPLKTYHPTNAPEITACIVYLDQGLGLVACSHRSTLGIMRVSTSINFDAGILDRLRADGVQWLEVFIRDIKATYRAPLATMDTHGKRQQRFGVQVALAIKYWAVNIPTQPLADAPTANPITQQMSLFEGA